MTDLLTATNSPSYKNATWRRQQPALTIARDAVDADNTWVAGVDDKGKPAHHPPRCRQCNRPTPGPYCSSGCAVAAMTLARIWELFPSEAHGEVERLAHGLERKDG